MPNYSLRLRPIYGQDEETGGERVNRGIGQALQAYVGYQDTARQERNEVAARGGVALPSTDQGMMGRVRGIGGALRRVLGRGDPTDPTQTGLQTGTAVSRDAMGPPPALPSSGPMLSPPPTRTDKQGYPLDGGAPGGPVRLGGTPPFVDPNVPRGPSPVPMAANRTPGIVPEQPRGIGAALQPYIHEGQGGRRYSIDPLYQQRVALEGHEMQADATERRTIAGEGRAEGTRRARQQEQIDAAIAGGMPPGEARARVLNNVMRYDEEFGAYRRPPSTGSMTFEQRQSLQKQRDTAAYTRAQLSSQGRENTDEFRRASLALQAADLALSAANNRAAGFERSADDAARTVPTDPIGRQIATSTPEGQQRVTAAESTAGANRDSATRIRGEAGAAATGTARSVQAGVRPDALDTGGRGGPKKSVGDRDAELKAQGKKADERRRILKAEGYNVR